MRPKDPKPEIKIMSFFLLLQSHLKDIQSAFVSILSDSDGKYYHILRIVSFGRLLTEQRESLNRQEVTYILSVSRH